MPQITINIDNNSSLMKLINEEIKSIDKDELHSIAIEMIKAALSDKETLKKIFFKDRLSYNYNKELVLSEITESMLKSVDINEECKEVIGSIKDTIINNNKEIVTEFLLKLLLGNVSKSLLSSNDFYDALYCGVRQIMQETANN